MSLFAPSDPVYHPLPPQDADTARNFPTKYAPMDVRGVAAVFDLAIIAVMLLPAQMLARLHPQMGDIVQQARKLDDEMLRGVYDNNLEGLREAQYALVTDQFWLNFPVQIMCVIPMAVLFFFFWRRYGATPGKLLFGLRIVNAADGGPLSWVQCVKRGFGYILTVLPLMLGFIWINFNKRRRAWHDYTADTVVLKCKRKYLRDLKKQRKNKSA